MSTHMGYKSLYIAWPSSAKQQLKSAAYVGVCERRRLMFRIFIQN